MNKNLSYTVWLRDKTKGGAMSIGANMRGLQRQVGDLEKAWQTTGTGAAATWAVGQTMQALTGPAREMNAARGELASLLDGDFNSTLDIVQAQAMSFATKFGKSSSEFVRASYDIQSAIGGLSGEELAKFTNASAVLATATKADTTTITGYMGTMYGIFETNANKMGKSKWVEQIAGQTALAVKMFKTTGSAMNGAFESLGARASNQEISSAEQFAVLGMMQSSMGGSVAGTAYASFMDALPNAQKSLKMNFSGADGKAMGMADVIENLKSELGPELSVDVVGKLNTAFGTVASGLIQGLWNKTDALTANIQTLSEVSNMQNAEEMAKRIADPYAQLGQTVNNVRIVFGQALDRALLPFVSYLTSSFSTLQTWMAVFPGLTDAVAYLTIGVVALGGALAFITMMKGVFIMMKIGIGPVFAVAKGIKMLTLGIWGASKAMWAMIAAEKVMIVAHLRLAAANMMSLVASFKASTLAGLAFMRVMAMTAISQASTALMAFRMGLVQLIPMVWSVATAFIAAIGWVPILIVGIVAGITALVMKWDELVAAFGNTKWFQAIQSVFEKFMGYLSAIGDFFSGIWSSITGLFDSDLSAEVNAQASMLETGVESRSPANKDNQTTVLPSQYLYQSTQNSRSTSSHTTIGSLNVNTQNAPSMSDLNAYLAMQAG